jgi:hypothetical protein
MVAVLTTTQFGHTRYLALPRTDAMTAVFQALQVGSDFSLDCVGLVAVSSYDEALLGFVIVARFHQLVLPVSGVPRVSELAQDRALLCAASSRACGQTGACLSWDRCNSIRSPKHHHHQHPAGACRDCVTAEVRSHLLCLLLQFLAI